MKHFEEFTEIILVPRTFCLPQREILFYFANLAINQIKYPEYARDETITLYTLFRENHGMP